MWAISTHLKIKVYRICFISMKKGCAQTQFSSKFQHFNACVYKHLFYDSQVVECHVIIIHLLFYH